MNKQSTNKALLGALALSLFGMASCVDNDYDLSKDIDMSVTVGGDDLSIPSSDTKDITLEKIFDLEEGSAVQADAEGNYALKQAGEGSDTEVTIKKIVVNSSEIENTSATVSLKFDHPLSGTMEADVTTQTSFNIEKTNVTTDVTELYTAETVMPASLQMRIDGNTALTLKKDFAITFPDYLTVKPQDGRVEMRGNDLVFTRDITVNPNQTLTIYLEITHIDFANMEKGNGLIKPGHLVVKDEVKVNGKGEIAGTQAVDMNLTTSFNIESIELKKVTAKVNPKINVTINPITISNLPDFLKDEKVTIDMTDPRIFLTVSNDSPIAVDFKGTLHSYKGESLLATVQVGEAPNPVVIPAGASNYVICLHRQNGTVEGADASVTVPDLNKLIETVPDKVGMDDIQATAQDKMVELTLGSSYYVKTAYEINAPLQFNEGTTIVYNDSFDGWNEDLKDIYFKELVVSMDATNTIPLGMEMTVEAVDAEGKVLEDVTATVSELIKAGTPDVPAVTSLQISLKTAHPDAFQKLDGLKYSVAARSSAETAGQVLNQNQHLKLDKMVIKVKGGVTVDLN